MPTLYTIVYSCTSLGGSVWSSAGKSGSKDIPITEFTASGNGVGRKIREVVSVTVAHTHWCSGGYTGNIAMGATLNSPAGSAEWPKTYLKFGGTVTQTCEFDTTLTTPEILMSLTGLTISWNSFGSSFNLWGYANEEYPLTITITFYSGDTVYYGADGEWHECEVRRGIDGEWQECEVRYGSGGEWIEV